jgi:hypothetical protein
VRRPPLVVVFLAVLAIALGETGGAAMSQLRPTLERHAVARIAANRDAHGLVGADEYDAEVSRRTVFAAEAGLSFFHTHAEGLGVVTLLASTLVASLVPARGARAALYTLFGLGALFPLGYLAYGAAVLELGREAGVEVVERFVLTPLGGGAILGLLGLALALLHAVRRSAPSA